MAVVLGYKSGSKQVTDGHVYLRFDWKLINQNYDNGESEISWTLTAGLEEDTVTGSDAFLGAGIKIENYNDSRDYVTNIGVNAGGLDRFSLFYGEETVVRSGVHKITNTWDEGSNSTMQANFYIMYSQTHSFSSGAQLFHVRGVTPFAFHTEAPDFNDAQNLTIEYICPAQFEGYLSFNLFIRGSLIRTDRIQVPERGMHTITFEFTKEQRNAFYAAMGTYTSAAYTLNIESWGSGNTYYSHQDVATGVFSLTDSAPVLKPGVKDTNPVTVSLTGNDSVMVRYWSNAEVTIGAEAVKGAKLVEYGVTNGAFTFLNSDPVIIENVDSHVFAFHATDDKGQTTRKTITAGLVDYIKLTSKVNANAPSGEGDMNVSVSGSYFPGSFGRVANELFVYFRYKEQGAEEFSDWIRFNNVVIDEENGTYSANAYLDGLDYQATYVFQSQAADALDTVNSAEYVVATIPIFDWGKNDFNFNVPVTIQGKRIGGANTILWSGNNQMEANASVELSEPISQQMHGISLIFSGAGGDTSWNMFYVPKEMVNLGNGGGHTFIMGVNAGFSSIGAKYLYFQDTEITGHATNSASGVGATNILFNNNHYVLRYVLGV